MEKIYITPNRACPELIIRPSGLKDAHGNKLPRKSICFVTNSMGSGQFTTDNPELQKFIENHEWFKSGKIVALKSEKVQAASAGELQEAPPVVKKTKKGIRGAST